MIQEIQLCVIILRNFERTIEEVLNKCLELKDLHDLDVKKIEELEKKLSEKTEQT